MRRLLAYSFFFGFCLAAEAQFNIDLDKLSGLSPNTHFRDDQLWSSEAANVAPPKWGNISFISPLRIGLKGDWEISTSFVGDFFCPQFYLKHLYKEHKKTFYIASKFSVSTAYSGFSMAKQYKNERILGTADSIPFVLDVGHELLLSHAFRTDLNCSDGSEWLILTFGLGTYFGYNVSQAYGLRPISYHFLANRAVTLTDTGATLKVKLWADWLVRKWIAVRGGAMIWRDFTNKLTTIELHAYGELFITRRFTVSAGLSVSRSKYPELKRKYGVAPMADLCYYFGRKARKKSSLFEPDGKKY